MARRRPARIVAVNRYYWPDHSATSQLLTDLLEHLAAQGRPVVAITSRQRYDRPEALLPVDEAHAGVTIRRLWSTRFGRANLVGRALDYLSFYASALGTLLFEVRRGDTILALTDPPLLSVVAGAVAAVKRARLVNWCQDLFPEIAERLGVPLVRGSVARALLALRNRSFRAAHANVVLCDTMASHLRRQQVPLEKTVIVHNWADTGIRPVPREQNPLRREWQLADRFVIGYSGNLGRAHDETALLELIRRLKDHDDVAFLFIGGGAGLERLKTLAAEAALANVEFRAYQPRERLSESLSVPDMHLVSLRAEMEGLIMPSKIYGILAAGRPTLFLGAPHGAIQRLVDTFGAGAPAVGGDVAMAAEWIVANRHNAALLAELGGAARRAYETAFNRTVSLGHFERVLTAA
ncbi:MAG: glycosyltransferase [Alphaproteobacteria bacterium]|nr:glycosyltransferase [Alphaproteobacteria bacterium]